MSIEFSEYTVMEGGGQATVCVVANGFGFTVSVQTDSPGTAGQHRLQKKNWTEALRLMLG